MSDVNEHLARAIRAGLAERHCVLCQSDVQVFFEEVVCPHWFLTNGARAFRLERLVRVFRLYDLASVLRYLKVVAETEVRDDGAAPWLETCTAQYREVALNWRKRRWIFRQAAGPPDGYVEHEFTVSTFYLGELIEEGRITLGPAAGEA